MLKAAKVWRNLLTLNQRLFWPLFFSYEDLFQDQQPTGTHEWVNSTPNVPRIENLENAVQF